MLQWKITEMKKSIYIVILIFILIDNGFGQVSFTPLKTGTYGIYADVSNYTELTFYENKTFTYIKRLELASSFKCTGQWKIKGNYVVLFEVENNENREMPLKWKRNENEICEEPKREYSICLTWSKNE